jgi:hypothetical protein
VRRSFGLNFAGAGVCSTLAKLQPYLFVLQTTVGQRRKNLNPSTKKKILALTLLGLATNIVRNLKFVRSRQKCISIMFSMVRNVHAKFKIKNKDSASTLKCEIFMKFRIFTNLLELEIFCRSRHKPAK